MRPPMGAQPTVVFVPGLRDHVPDHNEQFRAMGTLHYAELRLFWERERARRVKLESGN